MKEAYCNLRGVLGQQKYIMARYAILNFLGATIKK